MPSHRRLEDLFQFIVSYKLSRRARINVGTTINLALTSGNISAVNAIMVNTKTVRENSWNHFCLSDISSGGTSKEFSGLI